MYIFNIEIGTYNYAQEYFNSGKVRCLLNYDNDDKYNLCVVQIPLLFLCTTNSEPYDGYKITKYENNFLYLINVILQQKM